MEQETSGSTPLFAVFLLSIVSIVLVPYTLHRLFGGDEDDNEVRDRQTVPPWGPHAPRRPRHRAVITTPGPGGPPGPPGPCIPRRTAPP